MINENLLTCQICGKTFQHLGSHIARGHKITAREYKEKFGLKYNQPLISQEIYEKKSKHWHDNKDKYLKYAMENLVSHQFVKGHSGQHRTSEQERKEIISRLDKINSREEQMCEICRVKYKNLESHMYNKHKMLIIK